MPKQKLTKKALMQMLDNEIGVFKLERKTTNNGMRYADAVDGSIAGLESFKAAVEERFEDDKDTE